MRFGSVGTVTSPAQTRQNEEEATNVWPPLVSERKKGEATAISWAGPPTRQRPVSAAQRGHGREGRPERAFGPPGEKVSYYYFSFFSLFVYFPKPFSNIIFSVKTK
jgi:hypothetical protein